MKKTIGRVRPDIRQGGVKMTPRTTLKTGALLNVAQS